MVGIYALTNRVNGKVYIGQSWDIATRFRDYKSYRAGTHLAAAFKKYGLESFHFGIVQQFLPNAVTQEQLDRLEDDYIIAGDRMDRTKGYNMRRGGSHGKHGPESRRLLSEVQIGKRLSLAHRAAISQGGLGKIRNPDSIRRTVETRKATGGYVISEETRNRLRESHRGKKQSPESIAKMLEWRRSHYKMSEATKSKIANANRGKTRSAEQRERMRQAQRLRRAQRRLT